MNRKLLHERYHSSKVLQKRIIDDKNFTYRNLIVVLKRYVGGHKSILDIGCGVGTICFYLVSKDKSVVGLDISKNAIDLAKKNAKLLGFEQKIKFQALDFPKKVPGGKYDLVLMSEVLEHIPNDKKAVEEIFNLLSEDGIVIVSTPSRNAPLFRAGFLEDFDRNVGHVRRYHDYELTELFSSKGFEIIEIFKTEGILRNFLFTNEYAGKFIRFLKWWISDLVSFFDTLTIPLLGESQIYIVASKK